MERMGISGLDVRWLDLSWRHSSPDEPLRFARELDPHRYQERKCDCPLMAPIRIKPGLWQGRRRNKVCFVAR
jgi:hypothetical protein